MSRRRKYAGHAEFSSPYQITPYRHLSIFLNGLSLVWYILREKRKVVPTVMSVPRLGPILQFPLKREFSGLFSELQSVLSVPSKQTTHKLQQITIVSSSESIIHCFTQSKWLKIASCFTLQVCCQTSASHHDFTRPYWKGKVPCIEFGSPPLSWNYQIDVRIEACKNKFPKQYFMYLLTLSNSFNSVSSAFFMTCHRKTYPNFCFL